MASVFTKENNLSPWTRFAPKKFPLEKKPSLGLKWYCLIFYGYCKLSVFLHGICSPSFTPIITKKMTGFSDLPFSPFLRLITLSSQQALFQPTKKHVTLFFLLSIWSGLFYLDTLRQFSQGSVQDCIFLVVAHSAKIFLDYKTTKIGMLVNYIFSLFLNLSVGTISIYYLMTHSNLVFSKSPICAYLLGLDIIFIVTSIFFNVWTADQISFSHLVTNKNIPNYTILAPLGRVPQKVYLHQLILKIVALFLACSYAYKLPHTISLFYAHAITLTWLSLMHTLFFLPLPIFKGWIEKIYPQKDLPTPKTTTFTQNTITEPSAPLLE